MASLYPYIYILVLLLIGLSPFNFLQTNKADQEVDQGLRLVPPATVFTRIHPAKLSNLKQFTILIDFSSSYSGTRGYGRIVTYSLDFNRANFMIGQSKNNLVFRMKTGSYPRFEHLRGERIIKRGKESWIAVVYNGDKLLLYQDGLLKDVKQTGKLELSWNPNYPLVIGSEANGSYCWNGNIYSFAVFPAAFKDKEIRELPSNIMSNKPLIYYDFASKGRLIEDRGIDPPSNLSIPHFFTPYKRTILSAPSFDMKDYRDRFMDIFVNIVGFLPLGFLLAANLRRRPVIFSILLSVATGLAVSFMIEILQVFLPSRSSSMTDLICNTFGAFLGALSWYVIQMTKTEEFGEDTKGSEDQVLIGGGGLASIVNRVKRYADSRGVLFFVLSLIPLSMAYNPLRELLRFYDDSEYYTHLILIPLISGYLIFHKRRTIFLNSSSSFSFPTGTLLLLGSIILYFVGRAYESELGQNDFTVFTTTSALSFWIGAFILLYGLRSFQQSAFPFLFLIFMIPIPNWVMVHAIHLLKVGTAEMVDFVFGFIHIPYTREGFVFNLPGIAIEIADQCSGIRSSIALIITSVVASHIFLRSGWRKAVIVLSSVPMVIIKNTVRIVTLSLLASYVDKKFLTESFLHHSGGILFYIPSLLLLWAIASLLKKGDSVGDNEDKTGGNRADRSSLYNNMQLNS